MSTIQYKIIFFKKRFFSEIIQLKTLNKIILKNNLYVKYVKKAHDMAVINPKLDTYFLHSLHRQFSGFYSSISSFKTTTLVNSFNSNGTISHILGPKYEMLSLPWKTDLMFGIAKSELIRKL